MNISVEELMVLESSLFKMKNDLELVLNSVKGTIEAVNSLINKETDKWFKIEDFDDFFSEIKVRLKGKYSDGEKQAISGCLGYALRAELAGEDLSNYNEDEYEMGYTILNYYYDATKSQRDDPDFLEAFRKAEQYIIYGTPIRKTDRAGKGTKGTRLVDGLGYNVDIEFYVR